MPIVKLIRLTRPCGCSTPVLAIHTGSKRDTINLPAHQYKVNQHCAGTCPGTTVHYGWLTTNAWLKKYTHTRNRRAAREAILKQQSLILSRRQRVSEIIN